MPAKHSVASKINLHSPFRLFSDSDALVYDCCDSLQEQLGKFWNGDPIHLDSLLHLDSTARKHLRMATSEGKSVCFRASIRVNGESLLPVYWTVIPKEGGCEWFGFPGGTRNRIEGRLNELELIVAAMNDIVFELDHEGIFLNFWIRDPSVLFIPPELFIGKKVEDVLVTYFQPIAGLLLQGYDEARGKRKSAIVEYALPGTDDWFSCHFTPVLDPDSVPLGMLIIITDITSQKKLENSLRQSEHRYRDLFENANDIIYIIGTDSNIRSMNRKAEELLEYTENELVGQSADLFFTPERLELAREFFYDKLNGEIPAAVFESEFVSRSGKKIPVEISSRLIYEGQQPSGIHVTARDISHQRQSQQELAKSEARFRFLSEYAKDLICLHDPKGNYIYVSPSAQPILGYTPDELLDRSPYEFFHPEDGATVDAPLLQYRFRKKGGEYVWLESVSKPIVEDGEVIYIQTSSREITDRKMAEQELVERDRLSSALALASNKLLVSDSLLDGLDHCLNILGEAVKAECLFVLKFQEGNPELFHIWCEAKPCHVLEKKGQFAGIGSLLPDRLQLRAGYSAEFQVTAERDSTIRTWMTELGYKSLILTPIVSGDGSWGILGCGQKTESRHWSKTVRHTLITFASSVRGVIEKDLRDTQLRDSEERFRALFKNSLDIVFLVSPQGKLTYATPSLQKILGYDETEILQAQIRLIIHPEERSAFDAALKKLANGKEKDIILQLRALHRSGHWLWMELKGESKLSNPSINGIIMSLRDITEYIEIEKTLKHYSDRITGMLHSITDGFIAVDRDFYITMYNAVAQDLLDHSPNLRVGKSAWELASNAKTSTSYKALNQAVRENRTIRFEEYANRLNRWFDVSAFPFDQGLFIYFKDVSERKLQEGLLQLEKEVLEMHTGSNASLPEIANHLLVGLEALNNKIACAVCLVKPNLRDATCLSAPGLPDAYREFVENTPLDPMLTTCGRAILQRQQVIIDNIPESDLAEETRVKADALGIRASWSIPIISSLNEILGTFVVYFRDARQPVPDELNMISRATHILTMIIENKHAAENVRISNERYLLATRAANEAIWDWDAVNDEVFWGEGFTSLFGYAPGRWPSNTDNWEKNIHPDDRDRVLKNLKHFTSGAKTGLFMEEYRFRKSTGTYAIVIDKAYCIYDERGQVRRMIGSMEDVTDRKQLEQQLIQQEVYKQQQIARAVVDVQESERAEIGKELHDNVNQLLTTAKLFLEVGRNDPEMQHQMMKRSSDTIMSAINEIRKISRSLMPASISDLGLISSVNDLVQNIAIARQLVVDFRYDPDLDKLLNAKQKLMLFRIIQEQVNNVLKHAHASSLIIVISSLPDLIRLEIADNGIGFDLEQAKMKDGVGLSNILSRAAIFDAAVQVKTAPGKGCQLIIDLPNILKN
ncbi:PAS domain S-box protein [Flavihumibacter solisilvae]|uniref:histidine kinase n=1 Tax=Flavihumibacter solisilvae TaxID=1349421 RepID=A0A0C1L5M4_9BACT|nr:PAS domain S-box protein [Flavihumibacter solisilvae]KIC94816.1 hypothetical protein OI18_10155 [Flavihumibacter solisilvae]